jgi:hypothetical protein
MLTFIGTPRCHTRCAGAGLSRMRSELASRCCRLPSGRAVSCRRMRPTGEDTVASQELRALRRQIAVRARGYIHEFHRDALKLVADRERGVLIGGALVPPLRQMPRSTWNVAAIASRVEVRTADIVAASTSPPSAAEPAATDTVTPSRGSSGSSPRRIGTSTVRRVRAARRPLPVRIVAASLSAMLGGPSGSDRAGRVQGGVPARV